MLRSALIALMVVGLAAGRLPAQKPDSTTNTRPKADAAKTGPAKAGQAGAET